MLSSYPFLFSFIFHIHLFLTTLLSFSFVMTLIHIFIYFNISHWPLHFSHAIKKLKNNYRHFSSISFVFDILRCLFSTLEKFLLQSSLRFLFTFSYNIGLLFLQISRVRSQHAPRTLATSKLKYFGHFCFDDIYIFNISFDYYIFVGYSAFQSWLLSKVLLWFIIFSSAYLSFSLYVVSIEYYFCIFRIE